MEHLPQSLMIYEVMDGARIFWWYSNHCHVLASNQRHTLEWVVLHGNANIPTFAKIWDNHRTQWVMFRMSERGAYLSDSNRKYHDEASTLVLPYVSKIHGGYPPKLFDFDQQNLQACSPVASWHGCATRHRCDWKWFVWTPPKWHSDRENKFLNHWKWN